MQSPRDVELGCRPRLLAYKHIEYQEALARMLGKLHIVPAEEVAGVVL